MCLDTVILDNLFADCISRLATKSTQNKEYARVLLKQSKHSMCIVLRDNSISLGISFRGNETIHFSATYLWTQQEYEISSPSMQEYLKQKLNQICTLSNMGIIPTFPQKRDYTINTPNSSKLAMPLNSSVNFANIRSIRRPHFWSPIDDMYRCPFLPSYERLKPSLKGWLDQKYKTKP